jgi:hypothetical protein
MINNLRHRLSLAAKALTGNIGMTSLASMVLGGTPRFTNYNRDKRLLELEYYQNPVYSAIADLRARYLTSGKIKVKNIKTGEIISFSEFRKEKMKDKVLGKMFSLVKDPNPLQSTKEFFTIQSIFKDTFGNSFAYGNFALKQKDIKSIESLWAVWPQYVKPIMPLQTSYFNALTKKDIFTGWEFQWNAYTKNFDVDEIFHRKDSNIQLNKGNDLIEGKSRLLSLTMPLSNIKIAYESRNVIAQDRGMRGIISSDMGDATGRVPLDPKEKEELQGDFKGNEGYGFRKGQNQFIVTNQPVKAQMVDQDVRKLGLLEEIASDAMIVAHKYETPEILVKLYLQGATFENQEASERRMIQDTSEPEMSDLLSDLSGWLKTRDYNYEYVACFDELPIMQEDKKNASVARLNNNKVYKELFYSGACTYNTWLRAVGEAEINEKWADVRITEMDNKDLAIITNNLTLLNNGKEE